MTTPGLTSTQNLLRRRDLDSARVWASHANMPVVKASLLLIDDDRILRMMAQETLTQQGFAVRTAAGGPEAFDILNADPLAIDAIVLDREMPEMNGLEVLAKLKADPTFSNIPVIMLTGTGEPEKIQEGVAAGVFYYLVKPINGTLLQSVLDAALRERRQKQALVSELTRHSSALKAMKSCRIMVRTLNEAEDAASFLASVFPDPERVVVGLMELLVNAVEHGNLGLTYEEKDALLTANRWREDLDRRAALPENVNKFADVIYQNSDEGHLVQITDAGPGFDWRSFWHISPNRATASHGRGIARARMTAFDRMAYNQTGNSVTIMVAKTPSLNKADYAW